MTTEHPYAVDAERRTSLAEALWRHRWLLLGAALVAGALGFAVSFLQSSEYSASARLILTDPRSAPNALRVSRDAQRYVRNQAELIETSVVAERAAAILDGDLSAAEVGSSITAIPSGNLDLITIVAVRPRAGEAADVANAVAEGYQEAVAVAIGEAVGAAEASLEDDLARIASQIDAIDELLTANPDSGELTGQRAALIAQFSASQSRLETLKLDVALFGSGVQLFEPASVPRFAASPQPRRNAVAGAVIGLLAAGALAWWRTENSPQVARREAPAAILGAPLLGVLPPAGRDDEITVAAQGTDEREAFDFALSAMDFALDEAGASVVAVTSPVRADGKGSVVLNLAVVASTDGRRPLVVDADQRRRRLSSLGPEGAAGIVELANGARDLDGCTVAVDVGGSPDAVTLLAAGSGNVPAAGFFRSPDFKKAMAKIRSRGDLTLVDVPPVLTAPEAADIVAECDAVVVVVHPGTAVRSLRETSDRLRLTGRPVVGYVYGAARRGLPAVGDAAGQPPDADEE